MGPSSNRSRVPLSRDRILEAALAIADKGGLEALTMRSVAEHLSVEAMSLYYHVKNKDDILSGLLEIVVGEIDVPDGPHWKQATRARAISAHDTLVRHRWAARVWVEAPDAGPMRTRYTDAVLGVLRRGGLSADLTHHAYHVLENHILGYTLQQLAFPFAPDDLPRKGTEVLESLAPGELPHLVEHIRLHIDQAGEQRPGEFEFGLDLILDGLERLHTAA